MLILNYFLNSSFFLFQIRWYGWSRQDGQPIRHLCSIQNYLGPFLGPTTIYRDNKNLFRHILLVLKPFYHFLVKKGLLFHCDIMFIFQDSSEASSWGFIFEISWEKWIETGMSYQFFSVDYILNFDISLLFCILWKLLNIFIRYPICSAWYSFEFQSYFI